MSFDSGLQRIDGTTFRWRTAPRVIRNIGSFQWIALAAAYWIRRKEPFHALEISRRCAVTLIQVTATDPLCAGCHPNLVARAIVADRGAYGMRAMPIVIARKRRIVAAGIPDAVVNGVVPIVIVIGRRAVPAAVVRLQRVMRPALTCISSTYRDSLTAKPERPYIGRVRVSNARLNRRRLLRLRRCGGNRIRLRQHIFNGWIAFYSRHIRTSRQRLGNLAAAFYQNRIHDMKRSMLDAALAQPLQNRALRRLAFVP